MFYYLFAFWEEGSWIKYRLELYFEHPAVLTNEMCKKRAGTARVNASDRFGGVSLFSLSVGAEVSRALRFGLRQCGGQGARCALGNAVRRGLSPLPSLMFLLPSDFPCFGSLEPQPGALS